MNNGVLGNCPVGRLAIGIATDICRYRSSADRRHHRLVWVIRQFGDFSAKCLPRARLPGAGLQHSQELT